MNTSPLSAAKCLLPILTALTANVSAIPAHRLHTRPPFLYMRACIFAYANLLGYFVRYVCMRGIDKAEVRDRPDYFALSFCRTYLPRALPATKSRMRKEFQRGTPSAFCSFRIFPAGEKYIDHMVAFYFIKVITVHWRSQK